MAPEKIPWMNLNKNRAVRLAAKANIRKLKDNPKRPSRMIGFLPNLSDRIPQKGENRSCEKAKEAASNPIVILEASKCFAYIGSRGKTIEKATTLTNTER